MTDKLLTDDRLDRLDVLAQACLDLELGGRWRWDGNLDNHSTPALVTGGAACAGDRC